MKPTNLDHVDTAFKQLSFAIKLWHFLEVHPIDKDDFDIALTVKDGESRICLVHNEFSNYDEIRVASENNISICFGSAANVLWEAMRENRDIRPKQLDPNADRASSIASLTYMIRCCFAHGPAVPVWLIQNAKYRTKYEVGNRMVDLSVIEDGRIFNYASIGGYETLWLLKEEALTEGLI